MTTAAIMASPPAALFLLLTLIYGYAAESPVPRHLLYKNNSSGELLYCHLCTSDKYTMASKISEDCLLQNRGSLYTINGVDYQPWCREGEGLMPSCPEPRQPAGGWVDCGKTGTLVYGECQVHCPQYHQPQTLSILCQEEDLKWSAEPTCLVSECPPLQVLGSGNVTCESDGPRELGDRCNVTCPRGFHPNMPEVVCLVDGTWSTLPFCKEDMAPFTGDDPADRGNVQLIALLMTVATAVGILVALLVYRKMRLGRKYDVADAERTLGSNFSSGTSVVGSGLFNTELPTVTASRSALRLSWNSITSLFRILFHGDNTSTEAGQRFRDSETASSHMEEYEERETIEMHLLGQSPGKALEDQEGDDGDSNPSPEASPLLQSNLGSTDQEDAELGENWQQQQEEEEEEEEKEAAQGASKQVAVEVHSASEGELTPSSSSSEEGMKAISDKLDPYLIPPVGFYRRSSSSSASDRSKPTYQWNLQQLIGFKVIIKSGDYKMISKIVEQDEELMVSRGLEVQISAKCRDHDEEVENFNVRLFNEGTGRGEVIKEATGNSFRFIACLSFARETYILSAQTSRSRQKHMVRFTLYTQEGRTSAEDPDETKVKEVYGAPTRCAPSNLYSPFPQLEPAAPLVSNSNNETFVQKWDHPTSVSQDRKLPGRAGDVPDRGTTECSQPLCRLLDAEVGWMTSLLNKLEPILSRKEADSIRGLYLHFWPERKDHVDVVCWSKQGDRHCSPARVLLEELSQEGLTTGHVVRYFAHPAHPRRDVLHLLREAHPFQSCPACHQVLAQ